MNLKSHQRSKFHNRIRNKLIKDKCEICGSNLDLELHHDEYFRDMLSKSINILGYELKEDIDGYTADELDNITYIMLGMQLNSTYKTVCKECHKNIVHKNNRGRPTDNPLVHDVKVRLSKDTYEKLIKYCDDNSIDKAKAIRGWIENGLTK